MWRPMNTRVFRALTIMLFVVAMVACQASAAELLDFSKAHRRTDGVESGGVTPVETESGWSSLKHRNTAISSDYLFYDLKGIGVSPDEGSVFVSVIRTTDASDFDETLFAFVREDWSRIFYSSAVWAQDSYISLSGLRNTVSTLDPLSDVPGKGQTFSVVFAWKNGVYQMYVNGVPQRLAIAKDSTEFLRAITQARYLVLGSLPDPSMPSGAWDPISSRITDFGLYDTFEGWQAKAAITTIAVAKPVYGPGQKIVATMTAVAGLPATFSVQGVATDVAMAEVSKGVYRGEALVPAGLNIPAARVVGSVVFNGATVSKNGPAVVIDSTPPAAPAGLFASAKWGGELDLSWDASVSKDVALYRVYRAVGAAPQPGSDPYNETSTLGFTDTDVIPGLTYFYTVAAVDRADNVSGMSEPSSAKALQGEGPAIRSVLTDPLNKPMRPGQSVAFTIKGATRGLAKVEILGLGRVVDLAEVGKTGVYQGFYKVAAADSAATTAAYQVVGQITDDFGSSKFAGPQLIIVGQDILGDTSAPVISLVEHDAYRAAGFSGKLVAGDVVTVTMEGEAKGFASFSLVGVTAQQPMTEVSAGVYRGSYTIDWSNRGSAIPVEASLSDLAGNETKVVSASTLDIDTRVRLSVTANDLLLPADKTAKTRIVVKTTNANGDDVSGHELMLKLHTTDEYTGVVGGGKVANKFASKEDVDDIEVKWGGVTDSFGEVAATYTAGFAAKTALIIAKDLTSGDVGAGWLNTYVASTIAIQLTPASAREASIAPVVRMSVTPGWLTADGRSKARVRAWLTESDGKPIKGARMRFDVASDNGSIKTLRGITDAEGLAEADYRAGTAAGFVTILATAPDDKVSGSIQIELKADAPAKIGLVATLVSLPADGRSTSRLRALVTDINDNPNKQAPVVFSLTEGTGEVVADKPQTDDRGLVSALYTAGRTVGTSIIEARHTSRAPTTDELRRVYGTIFVPRLSKDFDREKIRVEEWYVKPGEAVAKGQALVKLSSKGLSYLLHAQEDGVLVNQVRHKKDYVELGDTIGYVEIDARVWKANYSK